MPDKVLILGGTGEARMLARRLIDEGSAVVTSLAGLLSTVPSLPGEVRVGGFGGPAAMADYLHEQGFSRVVDATHPFAATISANAAIACRLAGVPLERQERPLWKRHPGDRWHWADDMAMAARMASRLGRRVFLTVGAKQVGAFAKAGGPYYVVRLIDAPPRRLALRRYEVILGRGPFAVHDEIALMRRFSIDLVVTKASGGPATEAKITAARRLGIPVVLVRRPGIKQKTTKAPRYQVQTR